MSIPLPDRPLRYHPLHAWDLSPKEAVALQQQLRHEVRIEPLAKPVALVAGCDISFEKGSDLAFGGIVVIRLADLSVVDE
ncbi:MAG: hypothetical protein IT541_17635, partial [Hyphomicrobiales bacterium]|nr:hypothetical protein [Hyphomicrobiales bacterium]